MRDHFKDWTIVQHGKAESLDEPLIVIGCMTGTSADSKADFTLAVFDENGMPIAYKNTVDAVPENLRGRLAELSSSSADDISISKRSRVEAELTQYLAAAFLRVIKEANLTGHPKEKIILSPHGQTIDHKPLAELPYCDILLNGDDLAMQTGHTVISRQRQMPLSVSMAAPLAPVLIKKLFYTSAKNRVLLNGGGIANICILSSNTADKLTGFDTGPANGPIDALIQHVLKKSISDIPVELIADIQSQQCDAGGKLAASGKIIPELLDALLAHEYFKRDIKKKSADRADFDLSWIFHCSTLTSKTISPVDMLATLSEAVAKSITDAIVSSLSDTQRQEETEVIVYGGLSHNTHVMQRIEQLLQGQGNSSFTPMHDLHYDPDYFESLLMAYLGHCVVSHTPIDLSYCARTGCNASAVIPGSTSIPATIKLNVSVQALIDLKRKKPDDASA